MQQPIRLGSHEMMELHELLNFKTICAAKAKAIDGLVTDEQLKALVQQDLQQSLKALDELQTLLGRAQVQ
ncbi:spore coat protein [Alicyclobacillus acidiphilus]|uniref:spore coat protein n=1 Tax=Alicyclobacillus acidiphilus TaxID=182455 RepID=UPI000AE28B3B